MDLNGPLLKSLAVAAAVMLAVLTVLLLLRSIFFRAVSRWARKTETGLDDLVIESFRTPSLYLALVISLYIAIGTSRLPQRYVEYGLKALFVFIIFSATLLFAKIGTALVRKAVERSGVDVPVTGLSQSVVNVVIYSIGLLIIFNGLGISITPIITALGVGGLAVALALQDTLSNLFAGIHILLEKPLRVGDYVKLDSGEEGYVSDIGWRTTRIRMLANNIVIVPNSRLAKATITNYFMPERRMSLLIPVAVSYDSDPQRIEDILLDEAKRGAGEINGLLADPPPFVRFSPGFGDSSLNFTLICQVGEFVDQYYVQHELRKRIFRRFREEGVEIPFPIRTVYLRKEDASGGGHQGDSA
ncbi:MAG TPA: mechanosensitive ion channel family protein [Deltaproteobacteria bacterium]|nr:mechanosensitive ion channel family protein [Deltaproteobacteria bacterium]